MIEWSIWDARSRFWHGLLLHLVRSSLLPQMWMNRQHHRQLPLARTKPCHCQVGQARLIDPKREAGVGLQRLPTWKAKCVTWWGSIEPRQTITSLGWLWSRDMSLDRWCRCNSRGNIADVATVPCSWNIVIVFSFVSCDYRFQIVRCPLHMLPNRAAWISALVVAPASGNWENQTDHFQWILFPCYISQTTASHSQLRSVSSSWPWTIDLGRVECSGRNLIQFLKLQDQISNAVAVNDLGREKQNDNSTPYLPLMHIEAQPSFPKNIKKSFNMGCMQTRLYSRGALKILISWSVSTKHRLPKKKIK